MSLLPEDAVLEEFQRHLYSVGKTDDAKVVLEKIRNLPTSSQHCDHLFPKDDITMNYLINEKL